MLMHVTSKRGPWLPDWAYWIKPLAEHGRRLNDANNNDVSGRVLFNVFGRKSALMYNILADHLKKYGARFAYILWEVSSNTKLRRITPLTRFRRPKWRNFLHFRSFWGYLCCGTVWSAPLHRGLYSVIAALQWFAKESELQWQGLFHCVEGLEHLITTTYPAQERGTTGNFGLLGTGACQCAYYTSSLIALWLFLSL